MMKCTACGKEFDEGFPYCPWCGSNATTTHEIDIFRRIAAEEKLRSLRHGKIASGVLALLLFIAGLVFATLFVPIWADCAYIPVYLIALSIGLVVFMFVLGIICLRNCRQIGKQRQDFVSKLEKGILE